MAWSQFQSYAMILLETRNKISSANQFTCVGFQSRAIVSGCSHPDRAAIELPIARRHPLEARRSAFKAPSSTMPPEPPSRRRPPIQGLPYLMPSDKPPRPTRSPVLPHERKHGLGVA